MCSHYVILTAFKGSCQNIQEELFCPQNGNYYINCSALWGFPPQGKTVSAHVKNIDNFSFLFEIANQLLARLAPWMNVRYRVERSKRNSISQCGHVISSIYLIGKSCFSHGRILIISLFLYSVENKQLTDQPRLVDNKQCIIQPLSVLPSSDGVRRWNMNDCLFSAIYRNFPSNLCCTITTYHDFS